MREQLTNGEDKPQTREQFIDANDDEVTSSPDWNRPSDEDDRAVNRECASEVAHVVSLMTVKKQSS